MAGEARSGDAVVVRHDGDVHLLAVVDALGHGDLAADVADAAVAVLHDVDLGAPPSQWMEHLHVHLRGSRGAAATAVRVHGRVVEGCGVGNVELRSSNGGVSAMLSPGVLGHQVAAFRPFAGSLGDGERLLLFSDGLSRRVRLQDVAHLAPPAAVRKVVDAFGQAHDDQSALLAAFAASTGATTSSSPTATSRTPLSRTQQALADIRRRKTAHIDVDVDVVGETS